MPADPNFLYIGTSKAGSTWIFKALAWHPQIHLYPGKDLNYFTTEYHEGKEWYRSNFNPEPQQEIIGEIAHSYMVSEAACDRIACELPDAKLMLCLREPIDRTWSQYLDGIKNGKLSGTFEEELERTPSLIERSRYGTYVSMYLEHFSREQIHITPFDSLDASPNQFAGDIFDFLGVERLNLPDSIQDKVLPAGQPRVRAAATAAKSVARVAEKVGLAWLKGKAKTSPLVRNILYKPFTKSTRPIVPAEAEAKLRTLFAPEVEQLDKVAGTRFSKLWGYD